jgi:hypothetical protein
MDIFSKIQTTGISIVAAMCIHIGAAANVKLEACYIRKRNKSYLLVSKDKKRVANRSKFITGKRIAKVEQRQTYTPAPIAITLF